jgi:Tol biopolymer transport system component
MFAFRGDGTVPNRPRYRMSPQMPLTAGTKLGPYEITGPLGAGGMGEVYRARDSRLNRDVAIKVLPQSVAHDRDRIARFEQEAKTTAALNHPNIVALYDVGSEGGLTFVVSELLTGSTLRERLQSGALAVRKVIELAQEIVSGLAAAHARGIVHRDLKPDNIFVTTDGTVKILDFGLAKLTEIAPAAVASVATITSPQTAPGLVLGTVGYMAPEQVRGQSADHRADIFAFGTILYELLTSRRAFHGATPADTMTAILTTDPPELSSDSRNVPPALNVIMRRCLEKDPHDRYQSARDLGFALETVSVRSSDLSIAAPTARRRGSAAAIIAALVGAAALGAAWVLTRPTPATASRLAVSIDLPSDLTMSAGPAVSPDGHMLAFAAFDAQAVSRIWLRSLETFETRALGGSDGGSSPFWSPDSRSLGFFARGKMWRVELTGGTPRFLANVSEQRGACWGPDNVIVYSPQPDGGLYRVSADGGTPSPFTTLDRQRHEVSHRWPRFLPGGRQIVFLNRIAETTPQWVISVAKVDDGRVTQLLDADSTGFYSDGRLLFVRGAQVFAQAFKPDTLTLSGDPIPVADRVWNDFVGVGGLVGFDLGPGVFAWRPSVEGATQIVWKDRTGKSLGNVGPQGATSMVPSPDGQFGVFALTETQNHTVGVWFTDLSSGTTRRFAAPDTTSTSWVWSPDSRRIVYSLLQGAAFDLYVRDVKPGSADRLLLHTDGVKTAQSWSPDGKVILFNAGDPKTRLDLWALDLLPDAKPRIFAGGEADQCCGRFSPDGHWVAYVATDSGRPEVFVKSFAGTEDAVQVSSNGGGAPEWRANGRELYYIAPDNRLISVPVTMTANAFKAGSATALFRINTKDTQGAAVGIAFDSVYAPVGNDRFLVAESQSDTRASMVNLLFNWVPPPR